MAEVLSQSQIDALLSGISSGEIDTNADNDKKEYRKYDFKTPRKFTKEQMRDLDSIHGYISRAISTYLTGVMRVFCEITVIDIEENRYSEYSNAIADSALMALIQLKPEDDKVVDTTIKMDLPRSIGFFVIDRFLGGFGDTTEYSRDFTDIELAILEHFFQHLCTQIEEGWRNYLDLTASLGGIRTNPRLVQEYSPEDIVVIVTMEIKLKDYVGTISMCIPAMNLEEMMNRFIFKHYKNIRKIDESKVESSKKKIFSTIISAPVEVTGVLHDMQLQLSDILSLQKGDVIQLEKNVNTPVKIVVNGGTWFEGDIGVTKQKRAIKINKIM